MMMRSVSKRELFSSAWELYKKHSQFLFNVGVLLFSVQHFIPMVMSVVFGSYSPMYFVFHFAYLFITTAISLGVIAQMLKIIRELDIGSFSDIFMYFHKAFASIAGSFIITFSFVLMAMILLSAFDVQSEIDIASADLEILKSYILNSNLLYVLIGYIIAVSYLSIKTHFFVYLIVDKDLGVIAALKESFIRTTGYEAELFIIWVLIVALNLVGVLMYGIGLLFSLPFTLLTLSLFYKRYLSDI